MPSNSEFNQDTSERSNQTTAPSISLPKGGGAIRGMGEKFAANPVTGTGSMTVPIATSPGRSGFGPQLSLSYDSGAGNGPFGFGWNLSLPSITRKTDKGLPRYLDADEADVFILSGAEDLVPVLLQDAQGDWQPENPPPLTVGGKQYRIRRYRPRIEGLFARIERWTNQTDPADSFWRSISRDNITSWYGKTTESRIADPADPSRIFSWLICRSYDDKGNAIVYEYKEEDSAGIDLSQVHEKNRTADGRKVNRYLKRIEYGNRTPNRDDDWNATDPAQLGDWMFEVVFDYGEGHYEELPPEIEGRQFVRAETGETRKWPMRSDRFSSYRAGFEVRNYRLCQRVLMFHHFPDELGTPDYLVRSTEFIYNPSQIASFITQVTQSGYVRQPDGTYLRKSLPPLEFEYSRAVINDETETIDPESLQNLPVGVSGFYYQWLDLDGEGLQGVLAEQDEGWYYKRNHSPISTVKDNGKEKIVARFEPVTEVATQPSMVEGNGGRHQFLDLAGDGNLDLVRFEKPVSGFFERTEDEKWESFIPFRSAPNIQWDDPNLRFIDLTGDGHADILITENDTLVWYPSLAEEGFGPSVRIPKPRNEEVGPAVVFADGTQAIFVADLSGDGLTDIVRIRNGEVCYWPNLGYGIFGEKVTMDNSPRFDASDQFDPRRIRLADIDGSGTTDIIYLERSRVAVYRNECGNAWSAAEYLASFPAVDDLASVTAVDLLGNGTACLVWSSPLPGNLRQPMRYIDLMGGKKPHLLLKTVNNLGTETVVQYAPSTKFYLADKLAGNPWITRLPFPVHVVERVETCDHISRNRFVTRYAYHHGFYDGIEREFRGFGMVEQKDTEELAALTESGDFPEATNIDVASYVPTVLTKTWFHTGAYLEGERISRHFEDEYYHEGDESEDLQGLTNDQLEAMLLPDTNLPTTLKQKDGTSIPWQLTDDETREACRTLKGAVLRREIYALDGTDAEDRPYSATEQNYTVELFQPQGTNQRAVFFTHPRESIDFHYERRLVQIGSKIVADPRVTHAMTLEVDGYGNALKSVAIGYGRRPGLSPLQGDDRQKQEQIQITYTENEVTNPINQEDNYRNPLPSEARTYELIKVTPDRNLPDITNLFGFEEMVAKAGQAGDGSHDLAYEDVDAAGATTNHPYRRLIEQVRTLYRKDDLTALLPLGEVETLALPGESYKLAFTPGLLNQIYVRNAQKLLPTNPGDVLAGGGPDRGGYVDLDSDGHWWIPSGRVFLSPNSSENAAQELTFARHHFFLPHRYRDPFYTSAISTESFVTFDDHKLLIVETRDALENTVHSVSDYRVVTPRLVTDPNGNRAEVAFDALGMVCGTAVMGKENEPDGQPKGDSLADFVADLTSADLETFIAQPRRPSTDPQESEVTEIVRDLLKSATTRIVYDLDRFQRLGKPPFAATIARETHFHDEGGVNSKIQVSFSYSDGFGRESQEKIQAEPGPVPQRNADGKIIVGPDGQPLMTTNDVSPRWVGSGWTVFNNKGKPVRQYEPFFTDTHHFEFDVRIGVSPVQFYDPVERVVATLYSNHTWEKVVFDPWRQEIWDVNDTVLITDPKADADVGDFFLRLPDTEYLPTWYEKRFSGGLGMPEQDAANKATAHAGTPSVTHADALGRTFLTIAHNKFERNNVMHEEKYATRLQFDIEGNQRAVIDAKVRIVMRYDYDMLGTRIHQASMEAGERWMLNDVTGKPIYAWNSRNHRFRTAYDPLRRPMDGFLSESNSPETLIGSTEYGESQLHPETKNQRGRVVKLFDQASIVNTDDYDFKGNLLASRRQLAMEYKAILDWSANPLLEAEVFVESTAYDALNRPLSSTSPDGSVYHPMFNEANLLEAIEVNLRGAQAPTPFVANIDYDAKGRRVLIEYGNNVKTEYGYDPLTFRLTDLKTKRFSDQVLMQGLSYTYDPAGNITHIKDDAQQNIYFNNQAVTPSNDYTYDAIYRLINAQGREHIGQVSQPETTWNDEFRVKLPHPQDGQAMRRYTELYEYDPVGNFERMIHQATSGNWTRTYAYNEASQLEHSKQSNRLSSTIVGRTTGDLPPEVYPYDAHGNMLAMAHLPQMEWDIKDQLHRVDLTGGGEGFYVYDAGGQRVRKVVEKNNGALIEERIYLGGFEIFRRRNGAGTITLERETLHVSDDQQRIALVETRTQGNDGSPTQLIRYQFGNHLGSISLELDDGGKIISYEEYYPYGSTSYQVADSDVELSYKRYRYSGMERDEESGFEFHRTRYYLPWLARWASCDPIGVDDGTNLYRYVKNHPTVAIDPTGTDEVVLQESIPTANQTFFHVLDWRSSYPDIAVGYQMSYIQQEGLNISEGASAKYGVGVYAFEDELTARARAGFGQTKAIAKFGVPAGVNAERIVLRSDDGSLRTYIRLIPAGNDTTVQPTNLQYLNVSEEHEMGYLAASRESGQVPVPYTRQGGAPVGVGGGGTGGGRAGGGGSRPVQRWNGSAAAQALPSLILGLFMGGVQIKNSLKEKNTALKITGVTGGSLTAGGAMSQFLGVLAQSPKLIAFGEGMSLAGRVVIAPVVACHAWDELKSDDPTENMLGVLDMGGIAQPELGLLSTYIKVVGPPAAEKATEVFHAASPATMGEITGYSGASWAW